MVNNLLRQGSRTSILFWLTEWKKREESLFWVLRVFFHALFCRTLLYIAMRCPICLARNETEKTLVYSIDSMARLGYIRLFADEGGKRYRLMTIWGRQSSSESERAQDPSFRNYTDTLFSVFQQGNTPRLHKQAYKIVHNHDLIAVEQLRVKHMIRNRRLSKSIADSGCGDHVRPAQMQAAVVEARSPRL